MSHTPGPWRVTEDLSHDCPAIVDARGRRIAAILSQTYDPELCRGLNGRIEAVLRRTPEKVDAPRWTLDVSFAGLCVVRREEVER